MNAVLQVIAAVIGSLVAVWLAGMTIGFVVIHRMGGFDDAPWMTWWRYVSFDWRDPDDR